MKYYDDVSEQTMDKKPAVSSKLAKDPADKAGFTHYLICFKSHPLKKVYVKVEDAKDNPFLASIIKSFEAKKKVTPLEASANDSKKSSIAKSLVKEDSHNEKSGVVLSKEPLHSNKIELAKESKHVSDKAHTQNRSKAERLKELKDLLDSGLITSEEYTIGREAIIKE